MSDSITSRPNGGVGIVMQRCLRVARSVERARDVHGTSPCRPACRRPRRSPRTSSRARPSAARPAPAPARRPASAVQSSRRSSELPASRAGIVRRTARCSPSGSCTRAFRRSAASRHVLTTSRCSHVENCEPPRNCFRRTQTLASASCAASLASSGSRRNCAARAARPSARAVRSSASSAWRSPSFARCTRIGSLKLLVGERRRHGVARA